VAPIFEKGQWVVTSKGSIKEINGKPIYKISMVGERGETYGYVDQSDEVQPLCRLSSPEHRMQPAVGELGPLVALKSPYPMVNCVVGCQLDRLRDKSRVLEPCDLEFWWTRTPGLVFVRAFLMGFFLCRVPKHSGVIVRADEVKSSDYLMLNLVFRIDGALSAPEQFTHRKLETAPYVIASGERDKITQMLQAYRIVIHGRRIIFVNRSPNSSYPERSETPISVWKNGLLQDMEGYIELDYDNCQLPMNISPDLRRELDGFEDMPARPTWCRR